MGCALSTDPAEHAPVAGGCVACRRTVDALRATDEPVKHSDEPSPCGPRAALVGLVLLAHPSRNVEPDGSDRLRQPHGERHTVPFAGGTYGSPEHPDATGAFAGLKGWHTRGHLLRAVFEGVAFNHRTHVDALRDHFDVRELRLTGGGARSPVWAQVFADVLGQPVSVTASTEAGALGAALCAAVAAGLYPSVADGADRAVRVTRTFDPDPRRQAELAEVYDRYLALVNALAPEWERWARH
jgi:sugar (pentulose or hexulose) kinase